MARAVDVGASPTKLSELVAVLTGAEVIGNGDPVVSEISYDSRTVGPGQLFVALRGADFDGHDYILAAVANGAGALMVDRRAVASLGRLGCPVIVVEDTRAALAPVSARFFGYPSREISVIGITGTDGKTTTSYLLDHLLTVAGRATGMIGTVALRINGVEDRHALRQTTPESVENQRLLRRMVAAGCEYAIVEATSHGLDLHRLDDMRFSIGAVTNITHEHLEHHKTIAAYRKAKGILFERVAEDGGVAVINLDDAGAREMLPLADGARIFTYSRSDQGAADVRANSISTGANGSEFDLVMGDECHAVRLPMLGEFNIENALCAAAIASATGVPMSEIAAALSTAPSPPGRLARVDAGQRFSVVVDYAHTPESLDKVLRLLHALHPDGRLIVVFGSAGDRDTTKRPLQGAVAARLADHVIVTSEDPRSEDPDRIIADIAAGAIGAGAVSGQTLDQITDRLDAIRRAVAVAQPGDCILLAGKGHEGSIIWAHEKRPWDEAAAARQALAERGFTAPST